MKYIAFDIETTGLGPNCQMLSLCAMIDDLRIKNVRLESLPTYYCVFRHPLIIGEPVALKMNAELIASIATLSAAQKTVVISGHDARVVDPSEKMGAIMLSGLRDYYEWLAANGVTEPITYAGKNFAMFDFPFVMERYPDFRTRGFVKRRTLDPAAYFTQPAIDSAIIDTKTCCERAGVSMLNLHDAWDDNLRIIKLIRMMYCLKWTD